jgi:hypothetical protein
MGGSYGTYGRKERCIQVFVGTAEGKKPLGRPRGRWEDNTNIYQLEVGWANMDWTVLDQDRDRWRALVKAVMNFRVP